jgi:steroid delta-isomerase-like uncharacterized protein
MSEQEDNKEIARRVWEAVSTGDYAAINELFDESWEYHDRPDLGKGPAGLIAELTAFRAAVPDVRWEIEQQLAEGDWMMTRWTASGTHTGEPLMGNPPTGKKIHMAGIAVERVRNGKIIESWEYWNALDFMTQIGAIPDLSIVAAAG